MTLRPGLPSGQVTFLFTDIEASTRMAQALGDGYRPVLHQHRAILRETIGTYDGAELLTEGDSFFIAFNDASHALRILGIKRGARMLLEAAGAELVEMDDPEICCGFGGTFATKHPEMSAPMADDKLAGASMTGADYLVAGDAGCLLHLEGRRRHTGIGPPTIHFAELLARGLPLDSSVPS